jgi:hypothetical protein
MDNFDLRKYLSEGKLLKEDKTSFKSHSLELLQADIENAMDENDDEMVAILQKYVNPLEMAEESEVESILDTLDSALAGAFGESFDIVDSYRDSFNMGKSLKEDKGINYLKDAFEIYLEGGDDFNKEVGETETVKFKNDESLISKEKFEVALQSLPTTVKVDVYTVNFKKVGNNIIGTFEIK